MAEQTVPLQLRDAFAAVAPNVAVSRRFAVKWGNSGNFDQTAAAAMLVELERFWTTMTGEMGFDQSRGWVSEKRGTHLMNVYVTDTGLVEPGGGSYLGCDPAGVHYISTPNHYETMAHELGHLAEMGTMGFINNAKVGWTWEAVSNWCTWWFFPHAEPNGINHYLDRHQEPLDSFETRYQTWFFFKYLTERFGGAFVGRLWSTAVQDELPFEVIGRCLREDAAAAGVPRPLLFCDVFADFASRCAAWDFVTLGDKFRSMAGDLNGWSRLSPVVECGGPGYFVSAPRSKLCWFGFEVVNLLALLPPRRDGQPEVWQQPLLVRFQGLPHPQDWRCMFVQRDASGRCRWWPEGWTGHGDDAQQITVSSSDREVLLVVCPVGRHSDATEAPTYSLRVETVSEPWECPACTFINTGGERPDAVTCTMCSSVYPSNDVRRVPQVPELNQLALY